VARARVREIVMRTSFERRRWGLLLDILSEISDVERQLVVQTDTPGVFVPDDLLARWEDTFQGGDELEEVGVSEEMLSILLDFDFNLELLIDIVPTETYDKETYIREDEVWQTIRELAEWTLMRITEQSIPEDVEFSLN